MDRDDELIARAKGGDPDAWRELYRAHAGRLVVWLRTRPTGDAAVSPEDIAGEAWLVAAQRVADFDGSTEQFAGWLFGIARNLATTTGRRSRRRRTEPGITQLAEQPTDGPAPESTAATGYAGRWPPCLRANATWAAASTAWAWTWRAPPWPST